MGLESYPRKGVANEADERILMEKRRANVTTWDASPCLNATIDDLDLSLFKHYFLPKAMSEADLEADNRDIKYQLSSFGFFDTRYDCPTNAGVLFFAKNLRRLVGGAYVQYVRFAGKDRAADITAEHERKVPFPLPIIRDVYSAIKQNRKIKYEHLQDNLGIGETTVRRCINWLKDNGYISKEHAKIKGEWQLLK